MHELYIPPQIILIDNENIIISCIKCGLYENETIDNICSYSTEWTTNVIKINCSKLHTYKDFKSDSKNIKYIYDVIHSFLFEKAKIEKKASRKFCIHIIFLLNSIYLLFFISSEISINFNNELIFCFL